MANEKKTTPEPKEDCKIVRITRDLWKSILNGAPNDIAYEGGIEGALRHILKLPQLPKTERKARAA